MQQPEIGTPQQSAQLVRGLTLSGAVSLNMIDMIGVGPFITIPLIISAMGGPQAMLGWILGALIAMSDGLVWAELGSAIPGSGGTYKYLGELYGRNGLGRLMSFLFIWQLIFSAPLSVASGCIGLSEYSTYFFPSLNHAYFSLSLPLSSGFHATFHVYGFTFIALAACLLAVSLLYRRITILNNLSKLILAVVIADVAWVIFAGVTHFNPAMAFSFPKDAFSLSPDFFLGLGSAMLLSIYDYLGYYNVCFLGDEVTDPAKTVPKAIVISIALVAVIYIVMNISIMGVIPWQELVKGAHSAESHYVVSLMMQRVYGSWAGSLATLLIMWTAFGSVFSLLLGYSRVPYAAALDGNFFRVFGRVHSKYKFPHVSLLMLGLVGFLFCFLSLADVIAALVVIRIVIQFISQTVGLLLWRRQHPESPRPFKMWLYPLPAIISLLGFTFILFSRKGFATEIRYAAIIFFVGILIYLVRSFRKREWPFEAIKKQQASAR